MNVVVMPEVRIDHDARPNGMSFQRIGSMSSDSRRPWSTVASRVDENEPRPESSMRTTTAPTTTNE